LLEVWWFGCVFMEMEVLMGTGVCSDSSRKEEAWRSSCSSIGVNLDFEVFDVV
jgi:hypothetical protein